MFTDDDIEKVRSSADLVDVVSSHVRLKKAGRSMVGLCPFHEEKSPSFSVDPSKQLYHCFGCGEGGDIFSFVERVEGLDFPEAVEFLAAKAGVSVERQGGRSKPGGRKRLLEINAEAANFFRDMLSSDAGEEARAYLRKRHLPQAAIDNYMVGLAPGDGRGLLERLNSKGFTASEMVSAGLVSEKGAQLAPRFAGRVIFPVRDVKGDVVGFGGRVIDDGKPKYLNTAETPLFSKGSILYGLFEGKAALSASDSAIVVEGYTDVLALFSAGAKNVVATMGTALTRQHIKLLSRFVSEVVFVFDGDEAGLAAAERGLDLSTEFGLEEPGRVADLLGDQKIIPKVAVLPAGVDPADLAQEEGSSTPTVITRSAQHLFDFCLDQVMSRHALTSSDGKIAAAHQALEIVAKLQGAVAKQEYVRKVADSLGLDYSTVERGLAEARSRSRSGPPEPANQGPSKAGMIDMDMAERELLTLAIHDPSKAGYLREIDADRWSSRRLSNLAMVLADSLGGKPNAFEGLSRQVDEVERKTLAALAARDVSAEDVARYAYELYLSVQQAGIRRETGKLKNQLKKIDSADEARYNELFERLVELEKERRRLESETA